MTRRYLWVIEQKFRDNGKWYPWVSYYTKSEARGGMEIARRDNRGEFRGYFRIRKYLAGHEH